MKQTKGDKEEKLNKDLKEADMEKEEKPDQVKLGMEVEKEHADLTGGDAKKTRMIVDAHLKEIPDYYSRLKEMEAEAKEKED
jgi:hypothetical protein